MPYFAQIMEDNPAAYWRLGETAGAQALDASPNGRHAILSGSPALGAAGALASETDRSAQFDGVDDKLTLPALPAIASTLTIEFWFRPLSGGDAIQCLIGEAGGSPSVLFKTANGRLSVFYAAADHLNDTPLAYDTWHHVAIVIDAGAGVFYLNGVPDGAFSAFPSGFAPDRIGDDTAGNTLKGYLDEVALYLTALPAARVQAHYASAWRGLTGLRPRLRRELHDEDAANERWTDQELDRHLLRALDDISDTLPDEQVTTLTATPGSRDVSISGLEDLVRIDAVEFPVGAWPPEYVQFSTWGTTLTLMTESAPSSASDVKVYWGRRHRLDPFTTTLPARAEELLLLGASAYALLEWASFAVNRANLTGPSAGEDYARQGRERLERFRRGLRRLGRDARVRVSELYTPARLAPTQSTVRWEP